MRRRWPLIVAVLGFASAIAAQPTALTYQGRLKNGGQPASGLHDMRFRLFDAAQGGNQLGDMQCVNNITVADGLFTATIDFGQQFASPDSRFLEIQVRADTGLGCGNGNGFVTLTPRQPITAAPIANHARSAFALDAADGGPTNALIVDNEGRIGIGTGTPQATLQLLSSQGGPRPGEGIRILGTASNASNLSYMTFLNSSGTEIGYVGDGSGGDQNVFLGSYIGDTSLVTPGGRVLTATANGRVGIGTTTPQTALEVRGTVRLGANGDLFAPGGVENLRMIRGTVGSDGNIIVGTGFTSVRNDFGDYTVTFTTPFAQAPSVTTSADHVDGFTPRIAQPDLITTSKMKVVIMNPDAIRADRAFHFIAVGPR